MTHAPLVLVGNAKGGTIAAFRLEDGALTALAVSPVGAGCGTFAIDVARGLVYCATKDPEPAVLTLALDHATGALTEVGRRAVDDPLAYLALSREGRLLLGASYHGGWGAAWPVTDNGLGPETSRVEGANVHCVVTDALGTHAYFAALGDDVILQCALDEDGVLLPLDPPAAQAPQGSGPRHLVLSGDERSAYLLTEFTAQAIRYERDPAGGVLTRAEAVDAFAPDRDLGVSRFGADPRAEHLIWGADLHLAGFGGYLLCSERTESTLATIKVEPEGVLGGLVAVTDTEEQPRGFAVAPDSAHVVAVGERSGHATLYAIDADGSLTELDRVPTGEGPNWVRFA